MRYDWIMAAGLMLAASGAMAQSAAAPPSATSSPPGPTGSAQAAAPQNSAAPANAAQPGPAQPAAAVAPSTSSELRLAADTLVRVELGEEVSSKNRLRGDKFAVRLSAPIIIDGRIVAPKGAAGQGEVVYAEKGGGGGKPGKLVLAVRYVDVGSARIKLKALRLGAGGDSEFTQMEVAAQLIGPAVMFMNGHEVDYPAGTRASAKVSEDIVLPDGGPAPVAATPPVTPAAAPATAATPASPPAATSSTSSASPGV